jgi:hypothetical protein
MHGKISSVAVLVLVAGCAALTKVSQAPAFYATQSDARFNQGGSLYACRADGPTQDAGSLHTMVVSIRQDAATHRMLLALGSEPVQALASVGSTTRQLYANGRFAWSVGGRAIMLTDVDNIQTYACRPVNYGDAVELIRSEAAGGGAGAAPKRGDS